VEKQKQKGSKSFNKCQVNGQAFKIQSLTTTFLQVIDDKMQKLLALVIFQKQPQKTNQQRCFNAFSFKSCVRVGL